MYNYKNIKRYLDKSVYDLKYLLKHRDFVYATNGHSMIVFKNEISLPAEIRDLEIDKCISCLEDGDFDKVLDLRELKRYKKELKKHILGYFLIVENHVFDLDLIINTFSISDINSFKICLSK